MGYDNRDADFIEKCKEIDFSSESVNMEENLTKLKRNLDRINHEKETHMNKRIRKPIAITLAAAAVLCASIAVYGEELYRVVRTVMLGEHASYLVIEDNRDAVPIPVEIAGQLFDAEGNALTVYPEDGRLYNADGEPAVVYFESDSIKVSTKDEYAEFHESLNSSNVVFRDLDEGRSHFICDTLFPTYLPEGYVFDRIEYYSDPEDGDDAKKYMGVYYSNGENEMYSQVRYMDEETAFESAGGEVQETTINGYAAVIDGNALNVQIGDVMYMFFGGEHIDVDELISIAESLS